MKQELWSVFSTEAHNDALILRNIWSAIKYIANKRDYTFLRKRLTVTVATPDVEVTTDFKVKTISVWLNGSVVKRPVDMVDYYMPWASYSFVGSWDDKFVAKEVGTYTVIATVVPPAPTSTTDIIDLPEYVSEAVENVALYFAHKQNRMYSEAAGYLQIADAMLASIWDRASAPYPTEWPVITSRNVY